MVDVYKRNPNLKAVNVKHDFTTEEIEEYVKCMEDPIYFIEKYIQITTLDQENPIKTMELYDFQKDIILKYRDNRFCIVKCSRQVGKSTITCAFVLWSVLFQANYSVMILANKKDTASEILGKIQFAYERLPKYLQQGVEEWNKMSIELENGSRIKALPTSSSSARGGTYNLVLLEEFAFVEDTIADEFFASVFPTISSGKTTKLFIISTPNGLNHFYKYWEDANKEKNEGWNGFTPIEAHWSQVPGRDQDWYETQIRVLGEEKFLQEYGGDFIGSSNTLISPAKLKILPWKKPLYIKSDLHVFEEPVAENIYFISCDIAEGVNQDYTAFHVIDCTKMPYKQVARYKSKQVSDILFPTILHNVAKYYNNAYVFCEVNMGDKIPHILYHELEYENLLCTQQNGRAGQCLILGPTKVRGKLGLNTNLHTKKLGCSNLKLLVESDRLLIQDYDTIREFTTFIAADKAKNGYSAQPGLHDDLTMALVLFAWMTTQQTFLDLTDINTRQKIIKERESSQEMDVPFPSFYWSEEDRGSSFREADGTLWIFEDDSFE